MIAHVAAWRFSLGEKDDLYMEPLASDPLSRVANYEGIVSE